MAAFGASPFEVAWFNLRMFGNFGRRHPNLEFALVVLFGAVVGGFGLGALRYAIEITTK